jgi:hypothetical protein
MAPGETIERLAARCYELGMSPVDLSAAVIEFVAEEVFELAERDPRAILLGRRIVGTLLDCGWVMPERKDT